MEEIWRKIVNALDELSELCPDVELREIEGGNVQRLLERMQDFYKASSSEKTSLQEKLEKTEKDFQQLWELLDAKNTETETLDQQLSQAEEELTRINDLLTEANAANAILEQTKTDLETANMETLQEVERLELQLQKVEQDLETLTMQQQEHIAAADVAAKNDTLIEEYEKQNRQLIHDVELYEQNNQQLRDEVQALQQSWSWRLTAPLRWFRRGGKNNARLG